MLKRMIEGKFYLNIFQRTVRRRVLKFKHQQYGIFKELQRFKEIIKNNINSVIMNFLIKCLQEYIY